MSMPERDPRRDPRPGDRVQFANAGQPVDVSDSGDRVVFAPWNRPMLWSDLTLAGWRRVCRNATVLHAAPEGKP